MPVFVASLKDQVAAATLETIMAEAPPTVILNATGFAVSAPGQDRATGPFDIDGAPRKSCQSALWPTETSALLTVLSSTIKSSPSELTSMPARRATS